MEEENTNKQEIKLTEHDITVITSRLRDEKIRLVQAESRLLITQKKQDANLFRREIELKINDAEKALAEGKHQDGREMTQLDKDNLAIEIECAKMDFANDVKGKEVNAAISQLREQIVIMKNNIKAQEKQLREGKFIVPRNSPQPYHG